MDWTATRLRLRELGVVALTLKDVPGGVLLICELPAAQPGRWHRIETGPTANETEAAALALAEVEKLRVAQR